ncbi:hypothetical protein BDV18DRAFT_138331 [Aspergillus unguis]
MQDFFCNMGHKLSAINGVKSENYTEPGNAVNEIWLGNTEIISRLPFGANDMEQAGLPTQGMPKIPWHNFIIPLKRALEPSVNNTEPLDFSGISKVPTDRIVCCNKGGCIIDQKITKTVITLNHLNHDPSKLVIAFLLTYLAWGFLMLPVIRRKHLGPDYDSKKIYNSRQVRYAVKSILFEWFYYTVGVAFGLSAVLAWGYASLVYQFQTAEWKLFYNVMLAFVLWPFMAGTWAMFLCGWDLGRLLRSHRRNKPEERDLGYTDIEDFKVKPPVLRAQKEPQSST